MLVYKATTSSFIADMDEQRVVDQLRDGFRKHGLPGPSASEIRSWENSLQFMHAVVNHPDIPRECGVAIEYRLPVGGKRVDFILSGFQGTGSGAQPGRAAVIIELKQWTSLEVAENLNEIVRVRTFVGGRTGEHPHPSYQAWSYAQVLENYNEAIATCRIALHPCALLHNYRRKVVNDPLLDPRYLHCLESAPAFCHGEMPKLRAFIAQRIDKADRGSVLVEIEAGRIRPSKSLQDVLNGMLAGRPEFVMVDDQKVVFEKAIHLGMEAQASDRKKVLIVRGGPGTGKSVVAVNLLVHLTKRDITCQYVSKNSAPRNVYASKLIANDVRRSFINGLFCGSGSYYDCRPNAYGALVVDEAHRLNVKSGLYGNLGEDQTKELIRASRFTVFFIDEAQRVTLRDAGSVARIRRWADHYQAEVTELELSSQFRCNGSQGYLDWIDWVLGLRRSAPDILGLDYDLRVFEDPNEMAQAIVALDAANGRSRLLAGYCWDWDKRGRNNPEHADIVLPESGFARSWNLASTGTWAIDPGSIDQVGCVHTSQGLEFEYVGVIIGDDLRFQDGRVITDPSRRARTDQSLKGLGTVAARDPEEARRLGDEIIRNTYRVLLSRGQQGCFVTCTDRPLAQHLRKCLASMAAPRVPTLDLLPTMCP